MGLLDRLKSMVADMNPDEKKEFFEEFERQEKEAEQEAAPMEVPDVMECSMEQTHDLLSFRESIISAKLALGKLLVDIEEMKSTGISELKRNEDSLLQTIQQIKSDMIPDPALLDAYMIELPLEAGQPAKLVKQ
jgi:hypothetical protein